MPTVTENDCKLQENYWRKLTQFKYDMIYYSLHFSSCVKTIRWIRIISAVLAALATGAWMNWNAIVAVRIVCAIFILILQAISAGVELLPFEKRKQELREMTNLLGPVYEEMEADWTKITEGQLTEDEIQEKTLQYAARRHDIEQHFFKDDALPENKKLEEKAESDTSVYFETF